MDGLLTIQVPQELESGSDQEIYDRYIASGPKGDLGRSAMSWGVTWCLCFRT